MAIAAPSLQCADQINLARDTDILDRAGAKLYHIDIMDGHFVPNLALSIDAVKQLKEHTKTPLGVHLMVDNPEKYAEKMSEVNPCYLTFHLEATNTPIRLLKHIKQMGIASGIAINPATPVARLEHVLEHCALVLVMSVEPGYAGQILLESSYRKISLLDEMRGRNNYNYKIEVDGGTTFENLPKLLRCGTDIVVAGATSIFKKELDLAENFLAFSSICEAD